MTDTTRAAPEHQAFMRRALDLARNGWGQTAPNPMVGAVVVRDGHIVGEGFHVRYGEPHAEVVALRAAGDRARGATLYVSLEPCRHHGKTPPCTDVILAAGVTRVVFAIADPTETAGGGAALLRAKGVDVERGVLQADARELNAAFFHAATSDLPWTTLKLAVSIETAIANERGTTSWLTSAQSRAEVHRMRAGSDAIGVGIGTILVDDPQLDVRDAPAPRTSSCGSSTRIVPMPTPIASLPARIRCTSALDCALVSQLVVPRSFAIAVSIETASLSVVQGRSLVAA